jgi:hypothetical protein
MQESKKIILTKVVKPENEQIKKPTIWSYKAWLYKNTLKQRNKKDIDI